MWRRGLAGTLLRSASGGGIWQTERRRSHIVEHWPIRLWYLALPACLPIPLGARQREIRQPLGGESWPRPLLGPHWSPIRGVPSNRPSPASTAAALGVLPPES